MRGSMREQSHMRGSMREQSHMRGSRREQRSSSKEQSHMRFQEGAELCEKFRICRTGIM